MNQKKVLLADDDADDREIFEHVLGSKPDVTLLSCVENGREVLAYLQQATPETLPDLIILDHNMPMMNGLETLELIRADSRYASIKIVIYSTYSDGAMQEKSSNLGADMILAKPSGMKEYVSIIDQFLSLVS